MDLRQQESHTCGHCLDAPLADILESWAEVAI
jgi:hypothetical protein